MYIIWKLHCKLENDTESDGIFSLPDHELGFKFLRYICKYCIYMHIMYIQIRNWVNLESEFWGVTETLSLIWKLLCNIDNEFKH